MKQVVCNVMVAPLRKEPSHRSEMVSQLLKDETADVLETEAQFTLLRCHYDGYEGWCANNQLLPLTDAPATALAALPFESDTIEQLARTYLEIPYLWGGKSCAGIDCSGFSQQLFKAFGIKLPRDAWQQAELGEVVGFLQEAVCGDLAFFDNPEGRITHVGVMLNPQQVIHASGKVRIDPIDTQGIINAETGQRTHHLRIIKRHKKP